MIELITFKTTEYLYDAEASDNAASLKTPEIRGF